MTKKKYLESGFIGMLILLLVFSSSSCEEKNEICECFKTRLEIKNLIKASKNTSALVEIEKYKLLKIKKEACLTTIEPRYFEENGIERRGRSDREFLLEELGDCDAVRALLNADK
jgi:hypothetical protein